MKLFVILSVLVAGAYSARLDNTYIPPASAHSAGGFNLDTPKLAQASNAQQTYAAPAAGGHFQQQGGLNHGTFTSVSRGNGYQSVQSGSYSGARQQQYQAPQQAYQQPQTYQQPQAAPAPYPAAQQPQYQAGYASTTPIPILKCKR